MEWSGIKIDFRRCGVLRQNERDGTAQPVAVQLWTVWHDLDAAKPRRMACTRAKRKPPRITGTACGLSAAFWACKIQNRGEWQQDNKSKNKHRRYPLYLIISCGAALSILEYMPLDRVGQSGADCQHSQPGEKK